jgi:hypothetical protein
MDMATATSKPTTRADDDNGNGTQINGQEAAELVRSTAERAVARLPEVAATAQDAARDTQRRLEQMPDRSLVIGGSMSLGLAAGLFIGGANRLLVALALAPAAAIAATVLGRQERERS